MRRGSLHAITGNLQYISIHAPRVGCDGGVHQAQHLAVISIHAPRVGCDLRPSLSVVEVQPISIHAPRVGCDVIHAVHVNLFLDFNPRTPCGVRRLQPPPGQSGEDISIHAPRVGCDTSPPPTDPPTPYFNPRTPCGVRPAEEEARYRELIFQSTHPVWGATPGDLWGGGDLWISIHAPRVGCDKGGWCYLVKGKISIHAPRVGCDPPGQDGPAEERNFNPRTPCGVRPQNQWLYIYPKEISIHAPRVGCDWLAGSAAAGNLEFQSTHPVWGATGKTDRAELRRLIFQSTHPVWGATIKGTSMEPRMMISIHAPRVGCDTRGSMAKAIAMNFNPRTPCGVRPYRGRY